MSLSGSFGTGSHVRTAITLWGLNPGRTFNKSQKLRSSRPAAIISTRDRANSVTINTRRVRACSPEQVEPRASCLSIGIKSTRPACSAGAKPKIIPATSEAARAKSKTDQLMDTSLSRGRLSGMICSRKPLAQKRIARPTIPPSNERSTLSVSNCRIRRVRAAPSAWRTAISRPLALARASSRFATFTQPISRTNPTAPSNRINDWRTLPTTVSASGTNRTCHALCSG